MTLVQEMLGITQKSVKPISLLENVMQQDVKPRRTGESLRERHDAQNDVSKVSKVVNLHGPFTESKRLLKPVTKWKMAPFVNSARSDNLQLYHWTRENEATSTYPFAKCNVNIKIPKFSPAFYDRELKNLDHSWTLSETFYLWDLCELFDLRFHVIFDRYDPTLKRTIEEIKQRFYSVSKRVIELEYDEKIYYETLKGSNHPQSSIIAAIKDEKSRHPLVKFTYNPEQDRERKMALEKQYHITEEMRKKESEVIEMIKETELNLKKSDKKKDDLRRLQKRFDVPEDDLVSAVSLKPLEKPGSAMASSILEQYKAKLPRRSLDLIEAFFNTLGIKPPIVNSQAVIECYCSSLIDAGIMLNLEKKVEKLQREKEYWQQQLMATSCPRIPVNHEMPVQSMPMMVPNPNSMIQRTQGPHCQQDPSNFIPLNRPCQMGVSVPSGLAPPSMINLNDTIPSTIREIDNRTSRLGPRNM